jgi:hypothetical protein
MGAYPPNPGLGDSRQSIAGRPRLPANPRSAVATQTGWFVAAGLKRRVGAPDAGAMRVVLEWLGLVDPDRSRKEPVAVPSWAPVATATAGALLAGTVTFVASVLLRALAG